MIVYKGNRLLRGHGLGNIFGSLFRYGLPILSPILKKAGTYLGSKLFSLGANTLKDMNKGKKFKDSLHDQALNSRSEIIDETKAKIKKKLMGKGKKTYKIKGFPFGSVSKKVFKKRVKKMRKKKIIKIKKRKTVKRKTKKRKKSNKNFESVKRKLLF